MDKTHRDHRGLHTEAEVPVDLEHALLRAARDAEFKARLLSDPATAIAGAGFALTASESALLAALPRSALEAMVERVAPMRQKNTRFLRNVGAAAVVGGLLVASCDSGNDTALTGGVDSDTDVDSDSDSDTDTDADAGPDAGQ